jgi:hypothetical protein
MKMKTLTLLALIIFSNFSLSQDATSIYKNVVNSTVTIETDNGIGSGFFVAPNIIATNFHVIDNTEEAYCYNSNSSVRHKIDGYLAVDKNIDLVLLKVSSFNMPAVKFSPSQVVVGQKLFVIGSPKGLPATISDGIVSALRDFDGNKLIQMTAPISPGSSGGPVLNSNGELVGISVSQMRDGQNLNFGIPKSYLESLIKYKRDAPNPLSEINSRKNPILGHWITDSGNTHYFISENKIIMIDEGYKSDLTYSVIQSSDNKKYFKIKVTLIRTGGGHIKELELASDNSKLKSTICTRVCVDSDWIYLDDKQEP